MKNPVRTCGKRIAVVALLAAGLLLGATPSRAIDFSAKGQWLVGFGLGDGNLIGKTGDTRTDDKDKFRAGQRVRLQLDAAASENLSGTVYFEIGSQTWGVAANGGALGADGNNVVKLKQAYLDWGVPQTDLSFRMGIQGIAMPNVAGGSAIMDTDVAAVSAAYKFNDNVSLNAFWARPVNDNFASDQYKNGRRNGYLDNIDLFALTLPLTFDGVEATPWVMYGMMGKNALEGHAETNSPFGRYDRESTSWSTSDGPFLPYTLGNFLMGTRPGVPMGKSKAYTSMFFAGLPVKVTALDPLNIEFDVNYGYVEGFGRYDVAKRGGPGVAGGADVRANTKRAGWLAKALVEYKLDWGVPGIFGWYASGDDGDMKNGSERMPSIVPMGNFTSFMGDGNWGWAPGGGSSEWLDLSVSYAGTWGVGLQMRDVTFVEDLSHTFRVAYWGGTNSPGMTKYFNGKDGWKGTPYCGDGPYLTTNDGLLEFNLVNSYQIYENLEVNLELGYMVNMIDTKTWDRSWMQDTTNVSRQDAWKAQLIFAYTF